MMKRFLGTVVLFAVLAVAAYLNWDRIAGFVELKPATDSNSVAPPLGPLGAAPKQRLRFALIDPTTSTDASFREAMKADLIAALGAYVPLKPVDTAAGVPELVGIELTVRLVATSSLAYGQQNASVSIPSIPALPAEPDMTVANALDPGGSYDTWKTAEAEWSAAYDAATASAAAAVQTLQAVNLNQDESSGITAGAAALALLAPAEGDVAFGIFSDLDDNQAQQPAAFNGHPLLIVQPDPVGDIARWDSLYNNFTSWATSGGAGQITRVRPELAASAITTFVTGK